ncbi:MAG: hypothetical protein LUO79_07895 [Methanomassiliicoccales archaeon]|nr:hypothetical protein [Methanomassiliicoccales archaeon]
MAGTRADKADDEILVFRAEATRKVTEDRRMVEKLERNPSGFILATAISILVLAFACYLIYLLPAMIFVWLIAGILLYSYNFVILLIPTTTQERVKMREYIDFGSSFKDFKELVKHLILKRRKLAIEIGLTVFLSGMVPLALSFYIIFGIGLGFAIYLGFVTGAIGFNAAVTIVVQLVLIIGFLTMMVLLEPQAQGITTIARSIRERLRHARYQGRRALTMFSMAVVGIVAVSAILIIGAVLVPGGTLFELLSDLDLPSQLVILLIIAVLAAQVFVMRHFQVWSSRRMAANLLRERADRIESEVIKPIDVAMAQDTGEEDHCLLLENIKSTYYSWVIYDVVEQNLFGRSPIYLVAPRMGYIHNEKILDYVRPLRTNGKKASAGSAQAAPAGKSEG